MELWYLHQSGFALDTGRLFLIFDCDCDTPHSGHLADGVVAPEDLAGRDVVVLVSHIHADHYAPFIFEWAKAPVRRIRYILSDDIPLPDPHPAGCELISAAPHTTLELGDLTVETLLSTDEGVAFLLTLPDGRVIYHAGDLNWWHWTGETDDYNADMARRYKAELARLRGRRIDLAMVPVDPRLGPTYAWGLDALMRTADVRLAVPMHFADHFEIIPQLLADPISEPYRSKILPLHHRGEAIRWAPPADPPQ